MADGWCVILDAGMDDCTVLRCERCLSRYEMRLPTPTWAFSAIIHGFIVEHRECKEPPTDGTARGG